GRTWIPLTDGQPTLASGSVAFAGSDPNVMYVGTGESAGGVGFAHVGLGMLKSIDGGSSWSLLGQSSFSRAAVKRVRVHPTDANTVMAITSRSGFGRDSQEGAPSPPPFGVWKSTNGGITWTRKLGGQMTA